MTATARKPNPVLYYTIGLILAALLALDAVTPLGYAHWILYAGAVALCFYASNRYAPLLVAAISTVLLIIGFVISPASVRPDIAFVNRSIGAVTFWLLAVVVYLYIVSRDTLQRSAWLQHGRARLADATRGEHAPEVVGENVLRVLAEYLDANVATLYVVRRGELHRLASWALPAEAAPAATVPLGSGLLGQAVASQHLLQVSGLDASYLRLSSTLGSAASARVVVAPFSADGEVLGAVELGFAQDTDTPAEITDLLTSASEAIGMAVRSALYRVRLEDLLAQTQRQSEELQVQQEELRVSNEELEERGRALQASQARLEAQQADLEHANTRLEEHTQDLERQKQRLLAVQQELAESAVQLEAANQYKSQFLANMSHELRTPLNSSLILSKLLMDNKDGNLTSEQVRYARTIHASNADLLTLINDILDLSRVEAGHTEVDLETVPLEQVLKPLEMLFLPQAADKRLQFRIEQAAGAPHSLTTDTQRLQQILKNLVANALKFTEQGSVTLRVAPAGPGRVRFDVQDTGIGIPEDQREAIFDAFRQADGTTRRKYGGSGLGLAISREFAELLGGEIVVDSVPGRGSMFSLLVPVVSTGKAGGQASAPATIESELARAAMAEAQAALDTSAPDSPAPPAVQAQPRTPAPAPAARPTPATTDDEALSGRVTDDRHDRKRGDRLILVIEDDVAFARILYDLAHELDFDCLHAPTAQEGIELAREMRPCGILLDMGLPDNSGLSVLEQLKRSPETRHIPIHVVSVENHAETALHLGAIGYTLKPPAREQLAAAIAALQERTAQRLRRILVIEDDATLRENIELLLRTDDVRIVGVGTLAEARAELDGGHYDCVVMDLVLPDGSGYDLLELMARHGNHAMPPVIVYTGRSLSSEDERRLRRYSRSIIIKGARSPERLLDEVTLFLHSVEAELPPDRQRMLKEVRQRDTAFEGRTILLAEDDIRNIFALSQVIEPLGATLQIARNGREAVQAVRDGHGIELVLMDIMMPEMDGLAAIEEIRKDDAHAKLPIIALTAKAMASDRQRCLEAGANDYISKPIDVDKLLSLCRVWLPH